MSKQKKKKKISLMGLLIIVCVSGLISRTVMMQPKITKNKERIAELQNKIEYEKIRAEEVDALRDKVNTDEYIEKVARDQLGLVKENEKIFIDVASQ